MINAPVFVADDGFQEAWCHATRLLAASHWELYNLVVHIREPLQLDTTLNEQMGVFAKDQEVRTPKMVAYTIFPHHLHHPGEPRNQLFNRYNRSRGFYERAMRLKPGWGTYFRRMTHYHTPGGYVNQLERILQAISTRANRHKAAYTILIQEPGGETVRPLGGPCLNYITIQLAGGQPGHPLRMGMLAAYRNHDFLERAYGNYWGLCNLLQFMAGEVGADIGPMTCLSSHAFVPKGKGALIAYLASLP